MILSSRRALQISGILVAGLEKSTSFRHLQVSFSILYSLAVSLWPILSSSMITFCSWLNYLHSELYYGSSAQVLFSLILVKNGDIQSKVGSRSSLYSFMHNNFLVLQKCNSGGAGYKVEIIYFVPARICVTNFIQTITPGILDRFWWSKWPPKALKKTFQTVPKTSQSNQYSPSYQQISQWSPSYQTLNCRYLGNHLM